LRSSVPSQAATKIHCVPSTITSPHNPRLQELRRLRRRRERARTGRFVAEGEDLIAAAERAGWPAVVGFRAADSALGDTSFLDVEPAVLAEVSTLGSGARVIGIYEQRWLARPVGPACVYLHGVGDPGNVGAVLRAALAFGASCVTLGPGCADPCSPKAVRAGMGAIFEVPLARAGGARELPGERIALVAGPSLETHVSGRGRGARACPPVQPLRGPARGPFTLLVGAEREGLPAEMVAACERVANIPIASESLNAAMAATVALYGMTRGAHQGPAQEGTEHGGRAHEGPAHPGPAHEGPAHPGPAHEGSAYEGPAYEGSAYHHRMPSR
jgi:TrmH family RNA methyltransferase